MVTAGERPIRATMLSRRESSDPCCWLDAPETETERFRVLTAFPASDAKSAKNNDAAATASARTLCLGRLCRRLELVPDPVLVALSEEQRSDYERQQRNRDRIGQPCIDVAGSRHNRGRDQRKEATEPAVAEMVRQRQRRVANTIWESLHQECRNGTVYHRHVNHLDKDEQRQHRPIDRVRVRLHSMIEGIIGNGGDEVAGHHDPFPSDTIGEGSEEYEQGRACEQRNRDDQVRGAKRNFQNRLEKVERVELARVPDNRLPSCGTKENEEEHLPLFRGSEALANGSYGSAIRFLQPCEQRRFLQPHSYVVRHGDQHNR